MARYRPKLYSGDPRWIAARFDSSCARCGGRIAKGEMALWYPQAKQVYCKELDPCGPAHHRDFQAAKMDDLINTLW